jgi:hypothetical protein
VTSKRLTVIGAVLLLFAIQALARQHMVDPVWVDEAWDVPGVTLCADSIYGYDCARAIEQSVLATPAPTIRRLRAPKLLPPCSSQWGDTLRITLRDGNTTDIVNYDCDCGTATTHWYLGRIERIESHVVFVGHYEGYSYLLVNDTTGRANRFNGFPLASPDGLRVACASCDLLTGYLDNDLTVWNLGPDSLRLEYRLRAGPMPRHPRPDVLSWGPVKPRWISPAELRFRTRVHIIDNGHHIETDTQDEVCLRFDGTEWSAHFQ